MGNKKSTTLIALGVAVFVIGGALLFLVVRHNDKKSSKSANLTSASVTTTTLAPGTAVIPSTPSSTGVIEFKIPSGDNALAVQMDYFNGGAGYVRQGDKVNIYVVANKGCTSNAATSQLVKLLLSNVQVLEVLGSPPAASGSPGSYLLAVTPQQAEQLIYHKTFDSLYFTLTVPGTPPATTTGITCSNAF